MKPTWNYLLTALISGAATVFTSCLTTGGAINWGHCGMMGVVGAAVGAVNLMRPTPTS